MSGLGFTKQTVVGGKVIWQRDYETAQGGFALDNDKLIAGGIVPAGSVFGYDESTRKATLLKVAQLHANAADDATTYQVKKGHHFKVGDKIGAVIGGKAYAITAIDTTTNATHDVITVGTTLGVALTAADGVVLFESSATGATACALAVTPKGLLYQDVDKVEANVTVAVIIRGTVYERRIPLVPTAVKAYIPNIIFSQSY